MRWLRTVLGVEPIGDASRGGLVTAPLTPLAAFWEARSYWGPRIVIVIALMAAVVPLRDSWSERATVWGLLTLAFVATLWLHNRVSVVGRRVSVLASIVALTFVLVDRGDTQLFVGAIGLGIAGVMARRQIGSIRPRFVGIPRPDVVDEQRSPVEGTSDDAERLVDALDVLWGSTRPGGPRHGVRAAHAHGSGALGSFTATPGLESPIPLFTDYHEFDAVVRFSNFWGWGTRDDSRRTPRGMAIRITPRTGDGLGAGGDSAGIDFVLLDAKRFPVGSRDDVYGFVAHWGHKLRLFQYWLVDRTRLLALLRLLSLRRPTSYLTRTYHSVNTFLWNEVPVRFLVTPRTRRAAGPPQAGDRKWRLDRDLRERLSRSAAEFEIHLVRGRGLPRPLQVDARRAWPRWMPRWRLGTLHLTSYVDPATIDGISFDPHSLPVGVGPSDDEILMARRAAHAESRLRRCPI